LGNKSRARASALITIVVGVVATAWFVSRFVAPEPRVLCEKIVRLRRDVLRAGPETFWNWPVGDPRGPPASFLDVDACVREETLFRATHSGPRARLVKANVARCAMRAERLADAEDCAFAATHEGLLRALLHFP